MTTIFNFQKNKGFSLLELLIVITIIGLLATVILNGVSNSRAKAYNSQIKQQLTSFRTAAEMYFLNQTPTSYGPETSFCNDGIFNDLTAANGAPGRFLDLASLPTFTQLTCDSDGTAYAVKATLFSGNEYWCIDSKGASRQISGTPGSGTLCP